MKQSLVTLKINNMPEEAIKEFKQIFFEETGIELTDEEAAKQAHQMLEMFRLLRQKDVDTKGKKIHYED